MSQTVPTLSLEQIKSIIAQLPAQDLLTLSHEIAERLQSYEWMSLSQTGFEEWNDEEEDIYDVES
ncbi:hypothetical protein ACKFKF_07160 [Phormidesmis sp. 146-12]